jgi:ABC-type Fe3+-hydroxamate transport system substrate-binding protein
VRFVSLCPSITESLVAMGLSNELVGVTRYCVHPREVTSHLRKVGGTKDPDLDAVLSLQPDLVFMNAEENRREDVAALSSMLRVDVSHPRRVADVPPLLRRFGRLTGREEGAEEISSKVEEGLERIDRGRSELPSFRYTFLIWKDPWMTVGERTYIADLLRLAGGISSLDEEGSQGPDYPTTDEGSIVASSPEVVLLPDEPYRFREKHALFWRERLPSAKVTLLPGDDWCWHGVRTLRGLAAAEALAVSIGLAA